MIVSFITIIPQMHELSQAKAGFARVYCPLTLIPEESQSSNSVSGGDRQNIRANKSNAPEFRGDRWVQQVTKFR
ncbi:MAG: hypothetical protein HC768_24300 [Acaryochloris sp. CRU_2_0]|nr:hypothetical protein [Acaryochloris sp. CRU_2_0]